MGEQGAIGFIGPKGSRGTTGFMVLNSWIYVVFKGLSSAKSILFEYFNVLHQCRQPKRHEERNNYERFSLKSLARDILFDFKYLKLHQHTTENADICVCFWQECNV